MGRALGGMVLGAVCTLLTMAMVREGSGIALAACVFGAWATVAGLAFLFLLSGSPRRSRRHGRHACGDATAVARLRYSRKLVGYGVISA